MLRVACRQLGARVCPGCLCKGYVARSKSLNGPMKRIPRLNTWGEPSVNKSKLFFKFSWSSQSLYNTTVPCDSIRIQSSVWPQSTQHRGSWKSPSLLYLHTFHPHILQHFYSGDSRGEQDVSRFQIGPFTSNVFRYMSCRFLHIVFKFPFHFASINLVIENDF